MSQADIDTLTAALEESRANNATLAVSLEERDATLADLRAELETTGRERAEAVAALELSQADIDTLTAALEESRSESRLLITSVEDREADLAGLRAQLLALQAEQLAVSEALAASQASEADVTNRLQISDEEVLQLRDLLAARELEVGTLTAERDAVTAERDTTAAERDLAAERSNALTVELRLTMEERDRLLQELATLRDRSLALESTLSDAEERTTLAQREIDARDIRIEELMAALGTTEAALDEEIRLSTESRALIAQLNQQVEALREQLSRVQAALEESEASVGDRDIEIADLNARLNQALVRRVEELSRYRSEFFGRLREVIGRRDDIRVVGDRFVFQSEVLFSSGSATLQGGGKEQLARFAGTLLEIARDIPPRLTGSCALTAIPIGADRPARAVPVELGTVDGARHRGGAVFDRAGRAAAAPGRRRLRRVPAARPVQHGCRLPAQPPHRIEAGPALAARPGGTMTPGTESRSSATRAASC